MVLFITALLVAFGVSFACSLMESTLLSLTPGQVADIGARRPRLGNILQELKAGVEKPLAVILMINTSAHTIGAAVAGSQFTELFGNHWVWAFSLVFTFCMFQFTEILPKTLGVRYNKINAPFVGPFLHTTVPVLEPIIKVVQFVNRPFEGKRGPDASKATVEEISALAGLARLTNQIGTHQERIIKQASRLSQVKVQQVMIPVGHVSFLSNSQTLTEALIAAHLDAHTRFPVCDQWNRDRVLGYINFKEMIYFMHTNPNDPSLAGIIRPIHFASPDDTASELLQVMVDQHVHIAIVRDAGGKTLGLVTLEDVIEELVGELEDEFDRLPRLFHALSAGTWMVGGGIPVQEMAKKLGLAMPEVRQGTVAAWLEHRLGHVPKPGETLKASGLELTVRRVRRGRIFEVAVVQAAGPAAHPPAPAAKA
jgi:CBS domain containing-hemolysin-like protein